MYLSKPTKRILNWGLAAVATVLIGDGLTRSLSNPQTYSDSELAAISKAAENGESIVLRHKKTAAMIGVLEVVGGSIVLGLSALASSSSPDRILPKALDPEDTPIAQLPPASSAQEILRQRMNAVLEGCPQLRQCLSCESLIIIAPAGAGKSSVSGAIAFFRAIIKGHKIYICDPHATVNIRRGVWLIGKIFESFADIVGSTPFVANLDDAKPQGVTSIFDEFSGYSDEPASALAQFASDRVGDAIRNNRKFRNYLIFLCHGRDKGQMGGEKMPSGRIASWTKKSAVLELETDYSDEGEAVFSGRAKFKPPGAGFDDDAAYQPLVIPDFLNPKRIRSEFSDLFKHLQIQEAEIQTSQEERRPPEYVSAEDFSGNLEQAVSHLIACYEQEPAAGVEPVFKDGLSNEQIEVQRQAIAQLLDDEESPQKKLLEFYFSRKPGQLKNGWLPIRSTANNWGKANNFSHPELKILLAEMQSVFLVETTEKSWKSRIGSKSLILGE